MSRLEELIAELCPDRVKYKNLGERSKITPVDTFFEIRRFGQKSNHILPFKGRFQRLHMEILTRLPLFCKLSQRFRPILLTQRGKAGNESISTGKSP